MTEDKKPTYKYIGKIKKDHAKYLMRALKPVPRDSVDIGIDPDETLPVFANDYILLADPKYLRQEIYYIHVRIDI